MKVRPQLCLLITHFHVAWDHGRDSHGAELAKHPVVSVYMFHKNKVCLPIGMKLNLKMEKCIIGISSLVKHSGKDLLEEIVRLSLGFKFWTKPQGNTIIGINRPEAQDGLKLDTDSTLENLRFPCPFNKTLKC